MPILLSLLFGAVFTLAIAWLLGTLCLRRLAVPRAIVFAIGAAAESCIVFVLLSAGVANRITFALAGAVVVALFLWLRPYPSDLSDPLKAPADRITLFFAATVFAAYTTFYFINALAPEIEPDAVAYHLGLTAEYVRLGGFPGRVGFYEMLPQGLEMLFVPAFAFGRHSAAKLVHFAFLMFTLPFFPHIARRLALPDRAGYVAAILYFCAPMVGVTSTSAYTDAAGVFFGMAAFYLLLVWRDTRNARYLIPAGAAAGFCYAIKFTGAVMVLFSFLMVVIELRGERRRGVWMQALKPLTLGTALVIAPWLLRSLVMTGNPFAPLFNSIFPNRYFHGATERELSAVLASFHHVLPWRIPYELTVGGAFDGLAGPVFLLLPLGLLALRRSSGRLCWMAAVLLGLPWFWNTGARFFMPALPFLALAMVMVLPRAALWACLVLQAVGCWPHVISLYHPSYTWRLDHFPWRAALRVQPEDEYLFSALDDFKVARLIEDNTRAGDRIFSLTSVPRAYLDREVLEFWHSAQADHLRDALHQGLAPEQSFFEVRAEWPARLVWGLSVRAAQSSSVDWRIHDIALLSGDYQIYTSPQWRLRSWPNPAELPLAFDRNPATRWRTWRPVRAGMYVQAEFDRAQVLSAVVMTSPTPLFDIPFEFYIRTKKGWELVTNQPQVSRKPIGDIRMPATRAVLNAGYRYLLAYNGTDGNGLLGAAMAARPAEWGLEKAADYGPILLFRIR